jgi:integrase
MSSFNVLLRIFEPAANKAAMAAPDLCRCPLIALLYSGMRIGDATGIHCEDITTTFNGVDIVYLRK